MPMYPGLHLQEDRASTNITALKVDFGTQGGAEFSDVGH